MHNKERSLNKRAATVAVLKGEEPCLCESKEILSSYFLRKGVAVPEEAGQLKEGRQWIGMGLGQKERECHKSKEEHHKANHQSRGTQRSGGVVKVAWSQTSTAKPPKAATLASGSLDKYKGKSREAPGKCRG